MSPLNLSTIPEMGRSVEASVFDALREWTGFECLSGAMCRVPTIDVYVVGGTLRDLFLDRRFARKDFDFVVGGEGLDEFMDILTIKGPLLRNPFGLPRWAPDGCDQIYADILPIHLFDTGLGVCTQIADVLRQFDFTANALAFDLSRKTFHDPIGGRQDASTAIMRAVRFDYPDEPIAPASGLTRLGVLWIRILHYAAKLGFDIESGTLDWLRTNSRYINQRDAFAKTLFVPNMILADGL